MAVEKLQLFGTSCVGFNSQTQRLTLERMEQIRLSVDGLSKQIVSSDGEAVDHPT